MSEGWIMLHRKIQEHWIWKSERRFKWWIDILLTVNHLDNKVLIKGSLIDCNRGQSVRSLETWGNRWGVTKKTVKDFFELLQKDSMLVYEGLQNTTRITVCNYETYQAVVNAEETQSKRKVNAKETLTTHKQQCKECNNENNGIIKPGKPSDFIDDIVNTFVEAHGSYEIINNGKERAAAAKLLQIYKKKFPNADSKETLQSLRAYFNACVNIGDPWLHDNMSLSIIISKFNEINNYLKNGKHKGVGATDAELIELFATKYGIKH